MSRKLLMLALVAALLPLSAPAGALPTDREEVVVWEAGGLSENTLGIVDLVARITGANYTIVHSGSLRLMGVTRDGTDVQRPAPGYGFPVSVSALDVSTAIALLDHQMVGALAVDKVIMSVRSAAIRGAAVGDVVELEGWNGFTGRFEIGAIVPDERMDWAEVIVSSNVAASLGFDRPASVRAWDNDTDRLASLLEDLLPDEAPIRVSNPLRPQVVSDATLPTVIVKERFGEFSFKPTGGDGVDIDDDWEDANIVYVEVPRLGGFECHRRMIPYVRSALAEVEAAGLGDLLDPVDFQLAGGCYNARLMRGGDKGFALSRHAWGVAFDLNPSSNRYGDVPTLDPRIGSIFRAWGFAWGAGWLFPDGMHFEWTGQPSFSANPVCSAWTLGRSSETEAGWSVYAREAVGCPS